MNNMDSKKCSNNKFTH